MIDLTYRFLREDDFEDLHALASIWPVVRQLGSWPWPPSKAFTQSRCRPYRGEGFIWAMCDTDRLIGTLGVTGGIVGYNLHPDYHGQGIMTGAVADAIEQAFMTTKRDVLTASTWHDNAASAWVLAKQGFVHWQTRYTHARARGVPTLIHDHRLSRNTWQRLRSTDD
ncbi:GNAT family N-acetyltransferase [Yoonia sp. BS5-3]|uniref:GNAT family N-acetyltransferase n=1 Tax=Yoonia phaeophyticola TaxID=3137369 RepID=A0ABZ2V688_9RHOB